MSKDTLPSQIKRTLQLCLFVELLLFFQKRLPVYRGDFGIIWIQWLQSAFVPSGCQGLCNSLNAISACCRECSGRRLCPGVLCAGLGLSGGLYYSRASTMHRKHHLLKMMFCCRCVVCIPPLRLALGIDGGCYESIMWRLCTLCCLAFWTAHFSLTGRAARHSWCWW